jgi:hypothetical protein
VKEVISPGLKTRGEDPEGGFDAVKEKSWDGSNRKIDNYVIYT